MAEDPEQLEALLAGYVDGELTPEEARIVESHLAANPSGRALVERLRADREALRTFPRLTAPTDLSEDLRGQLERDLLLNNAPMSPARARRFSPPTAAIAAMLVIGLGLAGVAYVLLANRPAPYLATDVEGAPSESAATIPATPALAEAKTLEAADSASATDEGARLKREVADDLRTAARGVATEPDATITAAPQRRLDPQGERAQREALPAVAGGAIQGRADTPAGPITPSGAGATVASNTSVAASAPPGLVEVAAVAPAEPTLDVSESAPPPDVVAALSGRDFDLARRSVAIVVEQDDALMALAAVSRSARVNGTPLEMSDRAAELAMPPAQGVASKSDANIVTNVQSNAFLAGKVQSQQPAEVAAVAAGLSPNAAAAVQGELSQIQPATVGRAYEVPRELVEAQFAAQNKVFDIAATQPADAAIVVGAATMPASRPTANVIAGGERLRVTLVDPDAFDLRTQHEVTVDAKGDIELPSLEGVRAEGQSVDQLRASIAEAYKAAKLMRRPIVRVESIDSGAASKDAADPSKLLDVYLVIRRPTTQPATTQPTTAPSTTQAAE